MDVLGQAKRIAGKVQGGQLPPTMMEEPYRAQHQNQSYTSQSQTYTPQSQQATLPETWVTHSFIDANDPNIKWTAINRRNWRKKMFGCLWKSAIALVIGGFVFAGFWTGYDCHLRIDGLNVKLWSEQIKKEEAKENYLRDHKSEVAEYYNPESRLGIE